MEVAARLFRRRRPARRLPALSGLGWSAGLGDLVAFRSVRCAARAGLSAARIMKRFSGDVAAEKDGGS